MADVGTFSTDQLREFKRNPNEIKLIQTEFLWFLDQCLIRLGGCYGLGECSVVLGDERVLSVTREDGKRNVINAIIKDEQDNTLLRIDSNMLSIDSAVAHDVLITASSNKIKVWHEPRQVGFECHYSQMDVRAIEQMLRKDTPHDAEMSPLAPMPDIDAFYAELAEIQDQLHIAAIGQTRNDMAGTFIRWHAARIANSDKRVAVLNIVQCELRSGGRALRLGSGAMGRLGFCAGNTFQFH